MVRKLNRRACKGFTLIEMLVVILIISVLVGLLLPAISAARQFAKRTRARTEIKQIEAAWLQYYNDYRRFPGSGYTEMSGSVLQLLGGQDVGGNNRHRIRYLEFESGETEMRDPWDGIYQFELDTDQDNQVSPHGYGVTLDKSVATWSYGQDGLPDTKDDIKTWK